LDRLSTPLESPPAATALLDPLKHLDAWENSSLRHATLEPVLKGFDARLEDVPVHREVLRTITVLRNERLEFNLSCEFGVGYEHELSSCD
jgi:hypothetical protein